MNCQECPAAVPRAWPPRAGTAPWASWAQGPPWGQHPKGLPACLPSFTISFLPACLPSKDAGRRGGRRGCGGRGCAWGALSPPRHSAIARQRSSHNAPGQDTREHPPLCHCQSWPAGSSKASESKSLRSRWNSSAEADGGRTEAGRACWMAILGCNASSWRGHLQSSSDGWMDGWMDGRKEGWKEILLQPWGKRHKPTRT